jgi:hypothetical protein
MLAGIAIGTAWFAALVVCHIGRFHWAPPADRFKFIAKAFVLAVVGAVVSVLILSANRPEDDVLVWRTVIDGIVALVTMGCLFILYVPFYFVIATSLSVQTLNLMNGLPGGAIAIDHLRDIFASRRIIEGRVRTMVSNGYLAEDDGTFRLTGKGRRVAGIFNLVKRLWRLGAGG